MLDIASKVKSLLEIMQQGKNKKGGEIKMLTQEQLNFLTEVGYIKYLKKEFHEDFTKIYKNLTSSNWCDIQDSVNSYALDYIYSEEFNDGFNFELIEENENGFELVKLGTFKSELGIAMFLNHYEGHYLDYVEEVINYNYNYPFEIFMCGRNQHCQNTINKHILEMKNLPSVYNM